MPGSTRNSKAAERKKTKAIINKIEEISPKDPMPFEGGMGFTYVDDTQYLPFLGPDDNYANLLLQSRLLSTTHNACIVTKKNYCAGNGFQTVKEEAIEDKIFNNWVNGLNVKNESALEINKQVFEAFFTWGNVPIELARFEFAGKRYLYIYVHNFMEWRLGAPDPSDGVSKYAVQSKLFLKDGFQMFDSENWSKVRKLPLYNPRNRDRATTKYREGFNWVKDSNGVERTMIWYKNSMAGFDNYGLPSAVSALIYEQLEYRGARYNLDNLNNNMVVSAILALKGNLTQPEINRIGKEVLKNHVGDGKRGRLMVVGSEEGIDGSDLHNMETHKDGSYEKAMDKWSQMIILANEWDSVLAGIVSNNTLGKGSGFLAKIIEIKRNTVIKPAQNDMMDKVWRHIMGIANSWLKIKTKFEDLQIANAIDISSLTDVDITPAVKVNEIRQAKGLKEDSSEKGNMYLGELGAEQKKGVYVKDSGGKKEPNVQQE